MATPAPETTTPSSPPTSPALLQDALRTLGQCGEICGQLSIWAAAQGPRDGPLTLLLRKHTKTLAAEFCVHQTRISELLRLVEGGAKDWDDISLELLSAVVSTRSRLLEWFELYSFHNCEEREGHDGALNVLFASRFILQGTALPKTTCPYYTEDHLRRIGLGLHDLLQEFQPAGMSSPGGALPPAARQLLCLKLELFFAEVAQQFRPRSVHTYERFLDAPYILDYASPPCLGSYGVVRKFNHRRTGEALAIKTFSKVFDDETTRKILREIGILQVCSHKNIVQLVEAFRANDDSQSMHLAISPWAPCTLKDFLHMPEHVRATKCPWFQSGSVDSDRTIYRIMYELADAVRYLHANEIKHKDLKPDNILLHHEGDAAKVTPLITDFGVSKMFSKDARTNYVDSTQVYLAPEQLRMESSTLKADVWQLGCCFAHLLALAGGGRLAYDRLLDSYMRSADRNCTYIIANEHSSFMGALGKICVRGNSAQKRLYGIVACMLDLGPSDRVDIESVCAVLAKVVG